MPASRETAMDRDRDFRIVVSVLTPAFFKLPCGSKILARRVNRCRTLKSKPGCVVRAYSALPPTRFEGRSSSDL